MASFLAGTEQSPGGGTRAGSGPYGGAATVPSNTLGTRSTVAGRPGGSTTPSGVFGDRTTASQRPAADTANLSPTIFGDRTPPRDFDGNEQVPQTSYGTLIPSAYFRDVNGVVVDTDGNPITDAMFISSRERLPTGALVDDEAEFTLQLLRVNYSDFILVGENTDNPDVDWTWYQPEDSVVGSNEDDVTLTFKKATIEAETLAGLFAGAGASFGGSLQA